MLHHEKVIWEGKPKYKFRWAFLEIFGGGKSFILLLLIPILLVSIVFALIWAHAYQKYLLAGLLYLIIIIIFFGTELHKYIRRRHTHYRVTDNYILIWDFWYGKKYHHIIHMGDVIRFYLENYSDNCGVVHIFLKEKAPFVTRDFWSGNPRFHVTFEDVYPADEVHLTLRMHLMDWKRRARNRDSNLSASGRSSTERRD